MSEEKIRVHQVELVVCPCGDIIRLHECVRCGYFGGQYEATGYIKCRYKKAEG